MSWAMLPLRERLLKAIAHAEAPIFLLQAKNDYSTGPSEVLGTAIRGKGGLNRAKLYPAGILSATEIRVLLMAT